MDFGFLIVHLLRKRSNLLILHSEPNWKMSYQTLNNSVYHKRERGKKGRICEPKNQKWDPFSLIRTAVKAMQQYLTSVLSRHLKLADYHEHYLVDRFLRYISSVFVLMINWILTNWHEIQHWWPWLDYKWVTVARARQWIRYVNAGRFQRNFWINFSFIRMDFWVSPPFQDGFCLLTT